MLEEKVEDCEGGRRRLEMARKIVEIVEGWCRSAPPKPLSHLPYRLPYQTSYYTKNFFFCQMCMGNKKRAIPLAYFSVRRKSRRISLSLLSWDFLGFFISWLI